MEFQIKIDRICNRPVFGVGDLLMLRMVTFGMSNANDLTQIIQWLHALWSVLLMYTAFSLFQYSAPLAYVRKTNQIVSETIFTWFMYRNPFTIGSDQREQNLNNLFIAMGKDILSSSELEDAHESINMALILTGQL